MLRSGARRFVRSLPVRGDGAARKTVNAPTTRSPTPAPKVAMSERLLELAARGAAKRSRTGAPLSTDEQLFRDALKADVAAAGTWVDVGLLAAELAGPDAPKRIFIRYCFHTLFDALGPMTRDGRIVIVGGNEADRRAFLLYVLIRRVQDGHPVYFVNAGAGPRLFWGGKVVACGPGRALPIASSEAALTVTVIDHWPTAPAPVALPPSRALVITQADTLSAVPRWFRAPPGAAGAETLSMPPPTERELRLYAVDPLYVEATPAPAFVPASIVGNGGGASVDGAEEDTEYDHDDDDDDATDRDGGNNKKFAPVARSQLRSQLRRLSRSPVCLVMGNEAPRRWLQWSLDWPAQGPRVVLGASVSAVRSKPAHALVLLPCMGDELAVAKGPQAFLFAHSQWHCLFNGDGPISLDASVLKAFYYHHRDWLGPKMSIYFVFPADRALDLVWVNADPAFERSVLRIFTLPMPTSTPDEPTWNDSLSVGANDVLRAMTIAMSTSRQKKATARAQ